MGRGGEGESPVGGKGLGSLGALTPCSRVSVGWVRGPLAPLAGPVLKVGAEARDGALCLGPIGTGQCVVAGAGSPRRWTGFLVQVGFLYMVWPLSFCMFGLGPEVLRKWEDRKSPLGGDWPDWTNGLSVAMGRRGDEPGPVQAQPCSQGLCEPVRYMRNQPCPPGDP